MSLHQTIDRRAEVRGTVVRVVRGGDPLIAYVAMSPESAQRLAVKARACGLPAQRPSRHVVVSIARDALSGPPPEAGQDVLLIGEARVLAGAFAEQPMLSLEVSEPLSPEARLRAFRAGGRIELLGASGGSARPGGSELRRRAAVAVTFPGIPEDRVVRSCLWLLEPLLGHGAEGDPAVIVAQPAAMSPRWEACLGLLSFLISVPVPFVAPRVRFPAPAMGLSPEKGLWGEWGAFAARNMGFAGERDGVFYLMPYDPMVCPAEMWESMGGMPPGVSAARSPPPREVASLVARHEIAHVVARLFDVQREEGDPVSSHREECFADAAAVLSWRLDGGSREAASWFADARHVAALSPRGGTYVSGPAADAALVEADGMVEAMRRGLPKPTAADVFRAAARIAAAEAHPDPEAHASTVRSVFGEAGWRPFPDGAHPDQIPALFRERLDPVSSPAAEATLRRAEGAAAALGRHRAPAWGSRSGGSDAAVAEHARSLAEHLAFLVEEGMGGLVAPARRRAAAWAAGRADTPPRHGAAWPLRARVLFAAAGLPAKRAAAHGARLARALEAVPAPPRADRLSRPSVAPTVLLKPADRAMADPDIAWSPDPAPLCRGLADAFARLNGVGRDAAARTAALAHARVAARAALALPANAKAFLALAGPTVFGGSLAVLEALPPPYPNGPGWGDALDAVLPALRVFEDALRQRLADPRDEALALHALWLDGEPSGCRLVAEGFELSGRRWESLRLEGAVLPGLDARRAVFADCSMAEMDAQGADWEGASFEGGSPPPGIIPDPGPPTPLRP